MIKQNKLRFLLISFFLTATLLFYGDLPTPAIPTTAAQSSQLNRIESDHHAVSRVGQWTLHNTSSASGGSYLYSSGAVSDALILDFAGTAIEISYVENAGLGSFAIEIDNVLRRTVVTTSDETSFGKRAIVDYLENGQHQLKVYAVEGVIAIDAFFATLPPTESSRIEVAPPAATLVSPTGSTSANPPTFVWDAVSTSTWYNLYVNGPGGNIVNLWYTAEAADCGAGTGQCSATPSVTQLNGTHNWWVRTYGDTNGEWSAMATYTQDNGMVKPAAINMTAPTGDIATNLPTYTWDADPWAEWYNIWVGYGSTTEISKWYSRADAGCPDGTGTCSVTPTTRLVRGDHIWYMRGWNSLGSGNWQIGPSFNVTVGPPQSAATLVSPNSPITTNQPTFTWNAASEATSYRLYVQGPSGFVFDQTFTDTELGCPGGTGTCSYAPSGALLTTGGTHTFWVLAINQWGNGLWSSGLLFTYTAIAPVKVTLTTPVGSIDNTLPAYEWTADPNASWYQLWVGVGSSTVISTWYSRDQAECGDGAGTCSAQPTTPYLTPSSAYIWYVRSYNTSGSTWSDPQNFNLSNAAGFVDLFSTDSGNWTPTYTTNWTTDVGHYFTDPSTVDSYSTAYYSPQTYGNFDFYANLYRTGCLWCENGVIVRGTPTPLGYGNSWRSGYGFFYDLEGNFIVKRFDPDADPVILTPNGELWETTPALNWGETYNTLRVVANGDELSFYINGVLVFEVTDGTYTSGNVGIAMKRGDPVLAPGNVGELYANWAALYRFVLP